MMRIDPHHGCGTHGRYTRRHFLFGAATAANSALLRSHADAQVTAAPARPVNTARACIFINLNGAPSQLDTFDPKDAPWNPRDVNLDQFPGGIVLSRRFFPKLTTLTPHLTVLRSVSSWEAAHTRGQFYIQTAHSENPAFSAEIPHIGAVVAHELGGKGQLPPYFSLLGNPRGQTFLPGRNAPFVFFPASGGIPVLQHNFYGNRSEEVFGEKYSLLSALDRNLREKPANDAMATYASMFEQARGIMYRPEIDRIFKFTTDEEGRYGATQIGRALIVARNAVRARNGAVFLNITHDNWDTHFRMFDRGYVNNIYKLTNELDRAVGSLIEDLRASGDLATTLIVMMGEFGRTPGPLNSRDGRDHYKHVMSAVLVGGGTRGGRAIGVTDAKAESIVDPGWSGDRPIYVDDITATIYSALGIDWTKKIADTPSRRVYEYIAGAADGRFQPVQEVFG